MDAKEILSASDVVELKALGGYLAVKKCIEGEIHNSLGVNGWKAFFDKIQYLKKIVSSEREVLISICNEKPFSKSKREVAEILNLKISATKQSELKKKVDLVLNLFCIETRDPYEYYESTKLERFKNSSKLEGIDLMDFSVDV